MRIAMIGTGYVGLVSGTCFAEFGFNVTCVDKDAGKIDRLLKGEIPIYEPGLDTLVANNAKSGRLTFTTSLKEAVAQADVVFIAVGTPTRRGDGHADLSYVHGAAKEIAEAMQGYTVVVDKSTVPVGTAREVAEIIRATNPKAEFDVVSNPEFLREGAAIDDFMNPDRVVLGCTSPRAEEVMAKLYRPVEQKGAPILFTSPETAELIKYAGNGFLAMKITFINEMARLCEKVGADVEQVALGIGLDNRIGKKFLKTGPGYGGSCFPKDTLALLRTSELYDAPVSLIQATVEANATIKRGMVAKVAEAAGGSLKDRKVAVLGLAFKADTDDMRDSPAIDLVEGLVQAGANVYAYDPAAMHEAAKVLPPITYGQNTYEVLEKADVAVIVTEWNEFKALDLGRVRDLMAAPVLVDLRNLYEPQTVVDAGFVYRSLGRPTPARSDAAKPNLKVLSGAA